MTGADVAVSNWELTNIDDIFIGMASDLGHLHNEGLSTGYLLDGRRHPLLTLWEIRIAGEEGERILCDLANLDPVPSDATPSDVFVRDFRQICDPTTISDQEIRQRIQDVYSENVSDPEISRYVIDKVNRQQGSFLVPKFSK